MEHVDFGGVTDGSWVAHLYMPMASKPTNIKLQAHHDARVILGSSAKNGRPCPQPSMLTDISKPQIVKLRQDTYHCFGLLPWKTRALRVVTPNIFTTSKWCCRNITSDEWLLSRDITKTQLTQLSTAQIATMLGEETYLPDKFCTALFDGFLEVSEQVQIETKPLAQERAALCSEAELRHQEEVDLKRYQALTKADDTEVPAHIWDQRILPRLPQKEREPILNTIRGLALRWWRRNVMRDFLRWFKATHI
jgi:hypothetical protein